MTERTDQPESAKPPQDSPDHASEDDLNSQENQDVGAPDETSESPDDDDTAGGDDSEPEQNDPEPEGADPEPEEIAAAEDLGENAHQVVTALLGHQQDLVSELRGVYQRLEQVREVDYVRLENRVVDTEYIVSGSEDITSQVERLTERVEDLTAAVNEHTERAQQLKDQLTQARETFATQLADRDARIGAQNTRIGELESAVTAAADSAQDAHEKLDVLAEETQSRLIHRVQERVSPAAQQARSALNNIAKRLRR